jgi:hypothetical protein
MEGVTKEERILAYVLRGLGAIDLLAVLAVFLPIETMAAIHAWLGMGKLPDVPIVGYLTRSLSVLYALHGATILVLSSDVRRYAPVIKFLAVVALAHGIALFVIDLIVGMPSFWSMAEGPAITAEGTVVLLLLTRAEDSANVP